MTTSPLAIFIPFASGFSGSYRSRPRCRLVTWRRSGAGSDGPAGDERGSLPSGSHAPREVDDEGENDEASPAVPHDLLGGHGGGQQCGHAAGPALPPASTGDRAQVRER